MPVNNMKSAFQRPGKRCSDCSLEMKLREIFSMTEVTSTLDPRVMGGISEGKERAIDIILRIPDESMNHVIGILRNVEALTVDADHRLHKMERFFSAANNIQIDSNAIDSLRGESMIGGTTPHVDG